MLPLLALVLALSLPLGIEAKDDGPADAAVPVSGIVTRGADVEEVRSLPIDTDGMSNMQLKRRDDGIMMQCAR